MTFNQRLMQLRKQKGLSQEQLGEEIGVSRQTVSKWELGDTTPELEKLIQLSNYFEITTDELIGLASQTGDSKFATPRRHYEYVSKRKIGKLPLVHINVGQGPYKAKGVIAVGTLSKGFLSLGVISCGVFSFGAISAGVLSLGALSFGLALSVGALSLGTVSFGGLSVGILAIGGCAFGIYTVGGLSLAAKVALGGYAHGPIAIGDKTVGEITFNINQAVSEDNLRTAILTKFPKTWEIIINLFTTLTR